MKKSEIIENKMKEIAKANNKYLRAYLRTGEKSYLERIEVNNMVIRDYLAIS